jgi:hypothetical protein
MGVRPVAYPIRMRLELVPEPHDPRLNDTTREHKITAEWPGNEEDSGFRAVF